MPGAKNNGTTVQTLQIPIHADLPVGKNFQDHGGVPVFFTLSQSITPALVRTLAPQTLLQYILTRTGPLSSLSFIPTVAFLNGENSYTDNSVPDYQLYFAEFPVEVVQATAGLREEIFEEFLGAYRGRSLYLCNSQVLHPKSRGTVTIQSTNPYDPPVIDPNYFEDPKDIQDVVDGLKKCMRVGTSAPMQRVGSTPLPNLFPTCKQYAGDEDAYFYCLVREFVVTFSHQVGTAKMGDPRDPTTVVDPQLRVKNIKGLRVVDASIMPLIPSGNTNIPTIMVAEKASDIIKSTIKCGHHDSHEEWNHDQPNHDQPAYYPINSGDLDVSDQYDPFPGVGNPGLVDTIEKWKDVFSPVHKPPVHVHNRVVIPWNKEFIEQSSANLQILVSIVNLLSQMSSQGQSSNSAMNQGMSSLLQQMMQTMNGNQSMAGNNMQNLPMLVSMLSQLLSQGQSSNTAMNQGMSSLLQQMMQTMNGNQSMSSNNIQNLPMLVSMLSQLLSQGQSSNPAMNQGMSSLLQQMLPMLNGNRNSNNGMNNRTINSIQDMLQGIQNQDGPNKYYALKSVKAEGIARVKDLMGSKLNTFKENKFGNENNNDNGGNKFANMLSAILQKKNLKAMKNNFSNNQANLSPQGNDNGKLNFLINKLSTLLGQQNGNQDSSVSEMNQPNFLQNKLNFMSQKKNNIFGVVSGSNDGQSDANDNGNRKMAFLMSKLSQLLGKKNKGSSTSQQQSSGVNDQQNSNTNFDSMTQFVDMLGNNNDFSSIFGDGGMSQQITVGDNNNNDMRLIVQRLTDLLQNQNNGGENIPAMNNPQMNNGNKLNFMMNKLSQLLQKKNKNSNGQVVSNGNSQQNTNMNTNNFNMLMNKLTKMLTKKNKNFLSGRQYSNEEGDSYKAYDGGSELENTCSSLIDIMRCQRNEQCDGDREETMSMYLKLCKEVTK